MWPQMFFFACFNYFTSLSVYVLVANEIHFALASALSSVGLSYLREAFYIRSICKHLDCALTAITDSQNNKLEIHFSAVYVLCC